MTDTEKKIAEIREALEKATPGPWKIDEFGAVTDRKGNLIQWYDGKVVTAQKEDAHLIANAPEWLRFLLSELERLEREYAEERAAHNAHVTELCELEKENRKLRQEREKLIEGLRYLMKELGKLSVKPENGTAIHAYKKMRNILHEIGVTEEW